MKEEKLREETHCQHEWGMLDLGTGDYGSYYCPKCCQFQRDVEE